MIIFTCGFFSFLRSNELFEENRKKSLDMKCYSISAMINHITRAISCTLNKKDFIKLIFFAAECRFRTGEP